jgi:hypothetical protein
MSGGNKLNARLLITPLKGYVRFHAYSYNQEHDYVGKFIKLANDSLHKSKNLESRVE